MNLLKSRYSENFNNLNRFCPHLTKNEKEFFRTIFIVEKFNDVQLRQWKEITGRKRIQPLMDNGTFLYQLLTQCQMKNRRNLLLNKINFSSLKSSREINVEQNVILQHLSRSKIWLKRREILSDDAVIYLLSELILIESLSRKRQLFIQLSGGNETFYNLSYYQMRTVVERQLMEKRTGNFHLRKRTIQFHLHSTKQGQQAHLTQFAETLITRHFMYYHVSKNEHFDIYHPMETVANGQKLIEAMFQLEFTKSFLAHRPQTEIVRHFCFSLEQKKNAFLFLSFRTKFANIYSRFSIVFFRIIERFIFDDDRVYHSLTLVIIQQNQRQHSINLFL